MVTYGNNYYLSKISSKAKKVILSILTKKPDHTQLKKDVAEYYRLRSVSDRTVNAK